MDKVTVVKIGGNVIDSAEALPAFMAEFAKLEGKKILVHGGGKIATRFAKQMEVETVMIEGRRVTDMAMLDIVTMTYAGLINKNVVATLQSHGCNAIGLSGADGNSIKATKRPANPIDFGFVGDIDSANVNAEFLLTLLNAGVTPVFSAIMHNGEGVLLNCNADTVASSVALGMSRVAATDLVFCFEKKGVLTNIDDENSVISVITPENYAAYKADGSIHSGMIPKIDGALKAVAQGVQSVTIKHSEDLLNPESGTTIKI
ncbi:MAG: acetylglutamate kinase [Rikenellaceae bacterium]